MLSKCRSEASRLNIRYNIKYQYWQVILILTLLLLSRISMNISGFKGASTVSSCRSNSPKRRSSGVHAWIQMASEESLLQFEKVK